MADTGFPDTTDSGREVPHHAEQGMCIAGVLLFLDASPAEIVVSTT
ncbi:hypothetical protein [Nocardia farcinica]|nr:hypothetical protein [Nocardia farcinica]